eukprot:g24283.t1
MGLSHTCLFVSYVEQSLFSTYISPVPQLFRHYIDDRIGAASCSRTELGQFIDFADNFYPVLEFTWSISDISFPFLDISISISGD